MTIDLSSLGWDDAFAADFERLASRPRGPNELRPARVSRVDRGFCTALAADGPVRASFSGGLLTGAVADPARMPCAGDWVIVRAWPDERLTAEVVLPRRTAIIRAAAGVEPRAQVLAANLDTVAVVEPMDPSPDLARIERLLALAYQSGARPVVVLTKADLAADPVAVAEQVAAASAGAEVFAASARTGEGLRPLQPFIGYGKTLGLLGTQRRRQVQLGQRAGRGDRHGDEGAARRRARTAYDDAPGADPAPGGRCGARHPWGPARRPVRVGRRARARVRGCGAAGGRLPVPRLPS